MISRAGKRCSSPVTKLQVPSIFQKQQLQAPKLIKGGYQLSYNTKNLGDQKFAFSSEEGIQLVSITGVSLKFNLVQIIHQNLVKIVSKNLIYQVCEMQYEIPLFQQDNSKLTSVDNYYDITQYTEIQLDTLDAKQYQPINLSEGCTYYENIAFRLSNTYSNVFNSIEIQEIFNGAVNLYLQQSRYDWYVLEGFEELFTVSVKIVQDINQYLYKCKFYYGDFDVKIIRPEQKADISQFIRFRQEYIPCLQLMQILFQYYTFLMNNALNNIYYEDYNDFQFMIMQKVLLLDDQLKIDEYTRLINSCNLLNITASQQFLLFKQVYPGLCKMLYVDLLRQFFDITITKAHRMFTVQFQKFIAEENIFMLQNLEGLLTPPQINYISNELEILIPFNKGISSKEDFNKQISQTSSSVQEDVRKKNLSLLTFLRQLHFMEFQEDHYDKFPIHINIQFIQKVIDNKDYLITEPSLDYAVEQLTIFLNNILYMVQDFSFQDFYSYAQKQDIDYLQRIKEEINILFNNLPSEQQSNFSYITDQIQLITYEIDIPDFKLLTYKIQSILSMSVDIIIDNFSLDDELNQIDLFYKDGFLKQIQELTTNLSANTKSINQLISTGKIQDVNLTDVYFVELYNQVIQNKQFLPDINFTDLLDVLEFKISVKKAFTYLFQDNLFYYCFNIDTGQLDSFFSKFEKQCYSIAQSKMLQIMLDFSQSIIDNMRIFLQLFMYFETKPLHFHKIFDIQNIFTKHQFKVFYHRIFDWFFNFLQKVVSTFGSEIPSLQQIEKTYLFMKELNDIEASYGNKIQDEDYPDNFQYYKLAEVGQILNKKVQQYFSLLNEIEMDEIDKVFLVIVATHKIGCVVLTKLNVIHLRSQAYLHYLQSINLSIISLSSKVTILVQNILFTGELDKVDIYIDLGIEFEQLDYDVENKFEIDFFTEIQKHSKLVLHTDNFNQSQEKNILDDHLMKHLLNDKNKKDEMVFLIYLRKIIFIIKEILQLSFIKDQWYSCFSIIQKNDFSNDQSFLGTIKYYYENLTLVYTTMIFAYLNNALLLKQKDVPIRFMKIDCLRSISMKFLLSIQNLRLNWSQFQNFLFSQSINFTESYIKMIENIAGSQLNNIKYIQMFQSIFDKNIKPTQIKNLTTQFGISAAQSLALSGQDIIGSYIQYQNKLFDYCLHVNKQLVHTKSVFGLLSQIYVGLQQFEVDFKQNGDICIIQFLSYNQISFLQKNKLVVQHVIMQQHLISVNLVQFARDIESIIYIMLDIFYGINILQLLTTDLDLIRTRGNILQFNISHIEDDIHQQAINQLKKRQTPTLKKFTTDINNQDEMTIKQSVQQVKKILHDRKEYKENEKIESINLLGSQEANTILDACKFLNQLAKKIIKQKAQLFSLVIYFKNVKVEQQKVSLKELYKLVVELYHVRDRLLKIPYKHIFEKIQKQMLQNNQTGQVVQQQYEIFDLEDSYISKKQPLEHYYNKIKKFQTHQMYLKQLEFNNFEQNAYIIPHQLGQYFVYALSYSITPFILNQHFEASLIYLLENQAVNLQIFGNLTGFIITDSPIRGRVILSLQSNDEIFRLKNPIVVPQNLYQYEYLLNQQYQLSITQQVQEANAQLENQNFQVFLNQYPYIIQWYSLMQFPSLDQLKSFLLQENQKLPKNIAIACRLNDIINFKINWFVKPVGDDNFLMPYNLKLGSYWGGSVQQIEQFQLTEILISALNTIFQSFYDKVPVFLFSRSEPLPQFVKDYNIITKTLQRVLQRRLQHMYLTDQNFNNQYSAIKRYLVAGDIVIIINFQFLSLEFQNRIHDLFIKFTQLQGYFDEIYKPTINPITIRNAIKSEIKKLLHKQLDIEEQQSITQDDIVLQQLSYLDVKDQLGFLIFSVPLNDYNIQQDISKQSYLFFINKFKSVSQSYTYNVNQNLQVEYEKINDVFANKFLNLQNILKYFNTKIQLITVKDYKMVTSLLAEYKNIGYAVLFLDIVFKSYVCSNTQKSQGKNKAQQILGFDEYSFRSSKVVIQQLRLKGKINDQQGQYQEFTNDLMLIANLLIQIFNLNKQETGIINHMTVLFCNILIKSQNDNKSRRHNYSKYTNDFIKPYLNKQANQFIKYCCQKFQLTMGIGLEVFQLMNLLQFKKPILLLTNNLYNIIYMAQIIQDLSNIKNDVSVITDVSDFSIQQLSIKKIYIINPTSYEQFELFTQYLNRHEVSSIINRVFIICPAVKKDTLWQTYQFRYSCLAEFSQILPINLFIFSNKKKFDIFQLQRFYITNIYEGIDVTPKSFYRLKHLQNLFKGITTNLFNLFLKEFNLGNKQEEFIHLRSIFDFFLLRFNIMVIIEEDVKYTESTNKMENFFTKIQNVKMNSQEYKDSVNSKEKEFISQIETVDIKYQGLDAEYVSSVNKIDIENVQLLQQMQGNFQSYGIGNLSGCQIKFSTNFLEQFIQQETAYDSFKYLQEVVFISLWNTFSLFGQFYIKNIVIDKKWKSIYKTLEEYDLENYRPGIEKYFLQNYIKLIEYENVEKYIIQLEQSKYSTLAQVVKIGYQSLSAVMPKQFYYRQFCYINYFNKDDIGQYKWLSYCLGKGILKNVNLHKFINIQKQTGQSLKKNTNFTILKQQTFVDGMWDINGLVNNSTQIDDNNINTEEQLLEFMKLGNVSFKDKQSTEQILGFTNKQVQNKFKKEFNTNQINLQQDIQPLFETWQFIFLDDERIALSTLIACCFMSPSTFCLKGQKYSGKTTLIKIASVIIKDLIDFSNSMTMNLDDDSQFNSLAQGIIEKFELVSIYKQSIIDISDDTIDDIGLDIARYNSIQFYEIEQYLLKNINELQLSHAAINKIYEIITNFNQLQQVEKVDVIENKLEIIQQLRFLKFTRGIKFPVFAFEFNQQQFSSISHRFMSFIRDHRIILSQVWSLGLESQIVSVMGQVQLSDCSVIIELDENQSIDLDVVEFIMPNLSMQYLRRLFRQYGQTYNINMNDDWIQSFYYGINLIQSSLPNDIFNNFKFIESFMFSQGNLLPSYISLVKDSRRFNKTMDIAIEDLIQEMKPEIWTILISNYEKFNDQIEKSQETDFKKTLMQFVEVISQQQQQNPTYLQKIIALNQDFLFKSINIFTLFHVLSEQNIANSCFSQCLERFTSLNLLGYLNISSNTDLTTKKYKLIHPWQETSSYTYLYQTFQSVITQLCLTSGRSEQTQALTSTAFQNKFARKLFYFMKPLVVDHKIFVQKFPFTKVLQKFIKKLPAQETIVYQIEQFLLQNKMKSLYDAGLISAGIYETNSFFNAHIIQLYSQAATQYEPMLLIVVYQMLMYILKLKQRNASIVQLQIQLTNGEPQDIFDILNRDSIYNFKSYFISIINQFLSQKISKPNGSQHSVHKQHSQDDLISEDIADEEFIEQQVDSSESSENDSNDELEDNNHFNGFQNQAVSSIRFPIIEIKLNTNSGSNQYNMLIQLLSTVSQYKVMQADQFKIAFQQMGKTDEQLQNEDMDDDISAYSKGSKASSAQSGSVAHSNYSNFEQTANYDKLMYTSLSQQQLLFVNNLKHDRKLILDVQNILNMLTTYTHNSNRQHKKAQSQLNSDLVQYIKNFVQELQNLLIIDDDAIEYLVLLQIFRFAILMSLGIKPSLAFNQGTYNKNTMLFNYNIQSFFTGICLQSGLQQFQNTSKLKVGIMSAEFTLNGFPSFLGQRCQQYNQLKEEEDILISDVISGNQFPDNKEQVKNYIQDPQDVILILPKSFLQKKSYSQFSLQSTLLSSLQNSSFVQFLFDQQELQSILKLLSIGLDLYVELDNKSFYALLSLTFSIIIVDDLPSQKTDEIGNFKFNQQGIKSFGQIPNILEQSVKYLNSQNYNKTQNLQNMSHVQFNTINYQAGDLPHLFNVSGCVLPEDSPIFEQFQHGYPFIIQQFCHITINLFNTLINFCKQNTLNFVEFTQLASNIVNFYTKQIFEFFQNANYLFLIYHYYEALSSPLQNKPQLVDSLQSCQDLQKQISEELIKYKSGVQGQYFDFYFLKNVQKVLKYDKIKYMNQKSKQTDFDSQLLISTFESYIIRNLLYTIIEKIKPKYNYYQTIAQSSYIDGIICACYLVFQQSNILNDQMLFNQLRRMKFSHVFGQCQHIIQNINVTDNINEINGKYDYLLVYLISQCQEYGFTIDVQQNLSQQSLFGQITKFEKINYTQNKPLIVNGGFSFSRSIQHQIYQIGMFNYPIITFMQQLHIPIQYNDPVYEQLYNIAFMSQKLFKTTFLVNESLLLITACVLEVIKFSDTAREEYLRLIQMTLDEQDLLGKKSIAQDIAKKLLIVDLSAPSKEFQQALARAISISDSIVSFTNFSDKASNSNLVILRKFLSLRGRKVIQKRQTILIGLQTTITNQALHKYKIVIGCNKETLQQTLQRANMDTQEFLDLFSSLYQDDNVDIQSQQIFITTQNLIKSVFSNQATIRYKVERHYQLNTQIMETIKIFKEKVKKYFSHFVFDAVNLTVQEQVPMSVLMQNQVEPEEEENDANIDDFDFSQRINSLIKDADTILSTSIKSSAYVSANSSQIQDLQDILSYIQDIDTSVHFQDTVQLNQDIDITQKIVLKDFDYPINAKIQAARVIQQIGQPSCQQFALAIQFIISLFENYASQKLQFMSFLGQDFIANICGHITSQCDLLVTNSLAVVAQNPSQIQAQPQLKGMVRATQIYPIVYALTIKKQLLIEFFIFAVLPQVLKITSAMTEQKYQFALFSYINMVFFSFMQQERQITSFDEIREFVQQYLQTTQLNQQTELQFCFAQQIRLMFSNNSKFKLQSQKQLQQFRDILPSVVTLSTRLEQYWIKLASLSYNNIIYNILPWFLKYHSIFVQLSQCQNIFAGIVVYWQKTQCVTISQMLGKIQMQKPKKLIEQQTSQTQLLDGEEQEENSEDIVEEEDQQDEPALIKDRITLILDRQQKSDRQISNLPQKLQIPNPDTIFAAFLIGNQLQPHLLQDNLTLYTHLIYGILDLQKSISLEIVTNHSSASIHNIATGLIKTCQLTTQTERQRVLVKFWYDIQAHFEVIMKILSPNITYNDINHHQVIISDQMFTIAEFFNTISIEYLKYFQKIKLLMVQDEYDSSKHYQQLIKIGSPQNTVFIIYYDNAIDINSLLSFVYDSSDLQVFTSIPLIFTNKLTLQQLRDMISVINIDPTYNLQELQNIISFIKNKQTVYPYHTQLPIIITIPTNTHRYSASKKYIQQFKQLITQLIQLSDPYIAQIRQSDTLDNSFRHILSLFMLELFDMQTKNIKIDTKYQNNQILSYILIISIIKLQFDIPDVEICKVFRDPHQMKHLNQIHSVSVVNQYDRIKQKLGDSNQYQQQILEYFLQPQVSSKSKSVNIYEDDFDIFDDFEQDLEEVIIVEQQEEEIKDEENLSDWGNFSDYEIEEEEDIQEQELIDVGQSKEQNFYLNLITQINMFETQNEVQKIIDINSFEHQVKQILIQGQRVIQINNQNQIQQIILQRQTQSNQKVDNCLNIFKQLDKFLLQKRAKQNIRMFNNIESIRKTSFNEVKSIEKQIPNLLKSFLNYITQPAMESFSLQTPPEIMFQKFISYQLNTPIDAVIGTQTFGIFDGQWIFNINTFKFCFNEILLFIKFRDAYMRQIYLCDIQLIFISNKQHGFPKVEDNELILSDTHDDVRNTVFRDFILINGYIDPILNMITHDSPEAKKGFIDTAELYVYSVVAKEEILRCQGYVQVPLKIIDTIICQVFVKSESALDGILISTME
ncbi:hypothetical protein SS50377_27653 [Spironucleus salmonicida]|uniref:Uncharacterized protein n=1 Tax=Spironucleus salmonicida TaxID=348837 RepID=V6LPM5_9EUKA|nr:hypothetical protein SS50377_27653 [Spironucleus salmonicida]|eukprot:EST46570.1 hypothetical protein SS50377_13374 [Spironucleus salmonicida]